MEKRGRGWESEASGGVVSARPKNAEMEKLTRYGRLVMRPNLNADELLTFFTWPDPTKLSLTQLRMKSKVARVNGSRTIKARAFRSFFLRSCIVGNEEKGKRMGREWRQVVVLFSPAMVAEKAEMEMKETEREAATALFVAEKAGRGREKREDDR
ncbi:hypothetical protein HAX54_027050 [Datura stramonium]|uniref:Uncharacterized protein n=1 Tax=Datura stramonium TaxID=4076 RepID=A0ABS8V444_DATST|nr:hypothetical protein [Datura stramonium]